jgi:hypothetical protein
VVANSAPVSAAVIRVDAVRWFSCNSNEMETQKIAAGMYKPCVLDQPFPRINKPKNTKPPPNNCTAEMTESQFV